MRALILAAGFGSRLMPLTQTVPKCMVEYQGKRIIDYEIEALLAAGISRIAVVGGYLISVLRPYLKERFGITEVFENPQYDSTNMVSTLFCARDFLQEAMSDGDCIVISYADIAYTDTIVNKLLLHQGDFNIVIDKEWRALWEQRFANPLEDAETLKLRGNHIIELGKKPRSYDEIEGQYIGLFSFSSRFIKAVIEHYDSLDKGKLYDGKDFANMYMTSFLQSLIDTYHNAQAVFIDGGWREVDFTTDLAIPFKG